MISNLVKTDGIGALDGILVVDAVNLGGFNQNLGADLARTKSRGGVGRKVRITRTGGKNNNVALGKVVDSATANIGSQISFIWIALITRQGTSLCSKASCRASAFITVASMPM
mgnify:CR=1 FL=1